MSDDTRSINNRPGTTSQPPQAGEAGLINMVLSALSELRREVAGEFKDLRRELQEMYITRAQYTADQQADDARFGRLEAQPATARAWVNIGLYAAFGCAGVLLTLVMTLLGLLTFVLVHVH